VFGNHGRVRRRVGCGRVGVVELEGRTAFGYWILLFICVVECFLEGRVEFESGHVGLMYSCLTQHVPSGPSHTHLGCWGALGPEGSLRDV
jgi:hypothetical protein